MKKKPKISIIIPMYGVEKYLRRCLDSVLNQTFTDWQAICVDDGSPDKSGEIAEEYAKKDKRFVVIHKENGGLSDARNAGMPHATGDYILYIDSDDFIHPQTLEIAYSLALRDGSDIVSFTYDIVNDIQLECNKMPMSVNKNYDINNIKSHKTNCLYKYTTERNHDMFSVGKIWSIKHCQVWKNLYKRELIADIPFIKGIILEDMPWWMTVLLQRPRATIIKNPLYFYMVNGESILNSSKALSIIRSLAHGLVYSYDLYKKNATDAEFKHFNREFLWPFVIIMMQKVRGLSEEKDINVARKYVTDVYKSGACDMPCNGRAKKYKGRIEDFLNA